MAGAGGRGEQPTAACRIRAHGDRRGAARGRGRGGGPAASAVRIVILVTSHYVRHGWDGVAGYDPDVQHREAAALRAILFREHISRASNTFDIAEYNSPYRLFWRKNEVWMEII